MLFFLARPRLSVSVAATLSRGDAKNMKSHPKAAGKTLNTQGKLCSLKSDINSTVELHISYYLYVLILSEFMRNYSSC